jgi:molecular chaperone DnaK
MFTKLIERNTTIPTRKSETFSTAADGQTAVDVVVYQGERQLASQNKLLGRFQLTGIPPAPRGIPQIEVTFDIDANGIVNVSATDTATANAPRTTISGAGPLDTGEGERRGREAEQHAAEDAQVREKQEARNQADQTIYQVERTLKDLGDKVPSDEKSRVVSAISSVRSALEGDDVSRIRTATEELQQASYKLSEILYQQSGDGATGNGYQPGAAPGDAEQTGRPADDVIDAEFKSE